MGWVEAEGGWLSEAIARTPEPLPSPTRVPAQTSGRSRVEECLGIWKPPKTSGRIVPPFSGASHLPLTPTTHLF